MNKDIRWTPAMDEVLLNLRNDDYVHSEVAEIISMIFEKITRDVVASYYQKPNPTESPLDNDGVNEVPEHLHIEDNSGVVSPLLQADSPLFRYLTKITPDYTPTTGDRLFSDDFYEPDEAINSTYRIKRESRAIYDKFNDGKPHKILSLSDLHAPYVSGDAVDKAILNNRDADILVVNGDLLDGHSMSRFDKLNDFDFMHEITMVNNFFEIVSKRFPYIIWNSGNHERSRFERLVAKTFPQGMRSYAIEFLDPMKNIARNFSNVTVAPYHIVQLGKAIFIHPDGYSQQLMSTVLNQVAMLRANARDILPNQDFEAVIMGHTHDLGMYVFNDTLCIEQGCLTIREQEYKMKNPSKRRWVKGYAVVYLRDDGSVDLNLSRPFIID